MSDFDEELEEDLEDAPAEEEEGDDFEDPQQTTAALTMEINKLRQKNEVLRQFNVKQKDRYKDEVRSFLSPLIQKYKDLQSENDFLKRQIKEIGQSKEYFSKAKEIGENGGSHEKEDFVKLMESTIEEKEHEIAVLNKMVKTLEEESYALKRNVAELPELKEALKQKTDILSRLEEEKFDLLSKVEAKESLADRYMKQISDLETNIYVLNKRISERTGQFESGKVSEYEAKLEKANESVELLNQKIHSLEKQLSEYKQTMSSLEEELEEEEFLKSTSSGLTKDQSSVLLMEEDEGEKPAEVYDYTKLYKESDSSVREIEEVSLDMEMEDEYISSDELPSDDDLLAEDIELEEMSLEDETTEVMSHEDEAAVEEPALDEETIAELSYEEKAALEQKVAEELSFEDELNDSALNLEADDMVFDELSVEEDQLSIEKDNSNFAMEEMQLENEDILGEDSEKEIDSFDDLQVDDLIDDEDLLLDEQNMDNAEDELDQDKKHYDLRATNIENVQILSELKLETSPLKDDEPHQDITDDLFDDELLPDDDKSNPIDELPMDMFDEDSNAFDSSIKEENKSVKS